ncbi:MAG TPA: MBL fold metallo-hydrolase [Verrucomicrobiae bacterium]|jgi:L-ascorbate metabolism protein UlaG (beta-lactamase superfamily)|nr:MBL fold metallo-hydrolase [Verrucomicrobiae bacterium]
MKIVRLSWAGVQVTSGDATLVIDLLEETGPVVSFLGAPRTKIVPAEGPLDAALVTHLHPDHYDPATLRDRLKPQGKVFCDPANTGKILGDGLPAMGAELHQPISLGPFMITALPAVDGFGDPQISFRVEADGKSVVHCGDTLWHGHWWKIRAKYAPPDVVFVPINAAVTEFRGMKPSGIPADLTPEQAASAAAILGAKITCPIHYGTFHNPPVYTECADAEQSFLQEGARRGLETRVLTPGEEMSLG